MSVTGKKARHLLTVLRVAPGDMLYVRLPDASLVQMTVCTTDSAKKTVVLQLAGSGVESADSQLVTGGAAPIDSASDSERIELWLFSFVAKPPKMDLIVRQAVECGVSVLVPVSGAFCQSGSIESAAKKSGDNPSDTRWRRIITEAREQSGCPHDMRVCSVMSLGDAVELWNKSGGGGAVVLYERTEGTVCLHQAAASFGGAKRAALFVGAEGGISPEEIEFLQKNGVLPVHFATNILRCETACLYGTAALQTALMEKNVWQFKE